MERQRLDKWLWHARVVKARTSAAALVEAGHVRVNGVREKAPGHAVKIGDVITVGLDRTVRVTQAFKDCMTTRGYTWVSTRPVQNPPDKSRASTLAKDEFIDPDTGLVCHNTGFASICESPPADMTIRYTNKHGLNCTRTGAMSICSNL